MNSRMWIGITIAMILVVLIGTLWRVTRQKVPEPVIGAILPLTGDVASYGIPIKQGIDLAIDKVNSENGVHGQNVKVLFEDDKADPKEGVAAARKLISVNQVTSIIGAVPSSVTLAIAPIAENSHVVLLSPASSSPRITSAGDYIFRNYPSDELEGDLVAKFAFNYGHRSFALITINNDYGSGLRSVFKRIYTQLGGSVVVDETYLEGTQDFRSVLSKIKVSKSDGIFIVGYGRELGMIVKQARELGIRQRFYSTVNFYDKQSLDSGGSAVEGVIFSSPVFDPTSNDPVVQEFVIEFKKRFGKEPDVWSAHGYDALLLLVKAMRDKGLTSDHIKSGLYEIKDFPGVSGRTTFDSNGDVLKDAKFLTVKNGQFVPYNP